MIMPCSGVKLNFNVSILNTLHKTPHIDIFKDICFCIAEMLNVVQVRFITLHKETVQELPTYRFVEIREIVVRLTERDYPQTFLDICHPIKMSD